MLILEALNYSDDGEDSSKDFLVGSREVLGDGLVEVFNGKDDILMRCIEVV